MNKKPTTWNAQNPLDEVLSDGSYDPGVDLVSVDYLDDDSYGGAYGAAYLIGNKLFGDTQFETIVILSLTCCVFDLMGIFIGTSLFFPR